MAAGLLEQFPYEAEHIDLEPGTRLVTYTDAALKANKLSIIFEDIKAARETLDRVRQFVKDQPTVYLSTHCPEGYENLEMKRVMTL